MSESLENMPEMGPMLTLEGPGEFKCDECVRRCTRGPDGVEYGHARGKHNGGQRCSQRPDEDVDPLPMNKRGGQQ